MMKGVRFLSKYYLQFIFLILGFWVVVALSVITTRTFDNLFGTYYQMFPMMASIITGISCISQAGYRNVALGMNAGRRELYWANQALLAGIVLFSALMSALLWRMGQVLVPGEVSPSLWIILPLSAAALLAGECGFLLSQAKGTLLRVLVSVYIMLLMAICSSVVFIMLIVVKEQVAFGDFLTFGVITAVMLIAAVILAAVEYHLVKRAVVR